MGEDGVLITLTLCRLSVDDSRMSSDDSLTGELGMSGRESGRRSSVEEGGELTMSLDKYWDLPTTKLLSDGDGGDIVELCARVD